MMKESVCHTALLSYPPSLYVKVCTLSQLLWVLSYKLSKREEGGEDVRVGGTAVGVLCRLGE